MNVALNAGSASYDNDEHKSPFKLPGMDSKTRATFAEKFRNFLRGE